MVTSKIGIEVPAEHMKIYGGEVPHNVDPQHGGHVFSGAPAPEVGDCAASWSWRHASVLQDLAIRGRFRPPMPIDADDVFLCPKWDVDALVTATILCEVAHSVYMGTGSEHFFYWGSSDDEKLSERVELVRKLDTGELGQQLGDHPQLMGLARVASGDLPLEQKISVCRDWLMGRSNSTIDENAALAKAEVEDGLSDAVVTEFPHGVRLIETKTLGLPSRGRGAAQKLGFDKGAVAVVQFARDWRFSNGTTGTKFTITWKGTTTSRDVLLNMIGQKEAGWGGPNPQPNSFIVGSPMTGASVVDPKEVAEIVSDIAGGRAVACANCGGDGVCCTMTQLYFPKCAHDVVGATQPKTCVVCFPLQCTGCGWVGRASQLKPVEAREIEAREMDVRRLEYVPADESDLLSEATDHVFYARQGACPSCSRYMKIRKREDVATRTCSHCSTVTPRDNAQCYLCGLEEPRESDG